MSGIRAPSTGRPSHIMIGVDRPGGGVRVYASRELPTDLGWSQREIRNHIIAWHIDADMTHVLVIDAPTWGEAYARAFGIWENQDREKQRRFIEDGQRRAARNRVLDGPAHPAVASPPDSRDKGGSQ